MHSKISLFSCLASGLSKAMPRMMKVSASPCTCQCVTKCCRCYAWVDMHSIAVQSCLRSHGHACMVLICCNNHTRMLQQIWRLCISIRACEVPGPNPAVTSLCITVIQNPPMLLLHCVSDCSTVMLVLHLDKLSTNTSSRRKTGREQKEPA